jgi:hypothetical protein
MEDEAGGGVWMTYGELAKAQNGPLPFVWRAGTSGTGNPAMMASRGCLFPRT